MNPISRLHSEAAIWFYLCLTKSAHGCWSPFLSYWHFQKPLWYSVASSRTASLGWNKKQVSINSCPSKDGLTGYIFQGTPGTEKNLIMMSEALVSSLAQTFSPLKRVVREGVGKEVPGIRLCHIGRAHSAQKRSSSEVLPIAGSANSGPSWWPKQVTGSQLQLVVSKDCFHVHLAFSHSTSIYTQMYKKQPLPCSYSEDKKGDKLVKL